MPQQKGATVQKAAREKIDEYGQICIYSGSPHNSYEVSAQLLSEQEFKFAHDLESCINGHISALEISRALKGAPDSAAKELHQTIEQIRSNGLLEKLPSTEQTSEIRLSLTSFIRSSAKFVSHAPAVVDLVIDNALGYGPLAPMVRDSTLEEIMVNGEKRSVFVFHRVHGMCRTNISFADSSFISSLCSRIAATAQRRFDIHNPLLDARLPDGNRANATHPHVSSSGYTLTIRKFEKNPISVIGLIKHRTLSSELAAFLWVMVEGFGIDPMNVIVAGGAGAGKTTTLNALSSFIRGSERVVSIEDTLEIQLPNHENWVALEAMPATKDAPEVTMDELLQNALRMRPDRLIVGEVRGSEAQTMFVAMDIGHSGILGTVHANNAREAMLRLKSPPMSVPEAMLPLLDLILVQTRLYTKDRGMMRRVAHVAEVARMQDQVLLANIFEWDRASDKLGRTNIPAAIIEKLSEHVGLSKKELMQEIATRQHVLEWMVRNNITDADEVDGVIQRYHKDPLEVLDATREG